MAESLERSIVEVEVGQVDFRRRKALRIDGKSVVVRSDLYPAGAHVLDRLVTAAVPELELETSAAKGQSEKLMAEADSKDWRRPNQTLNLTHDSGQSGRITRTIRKEDAIRRESQNVVGGCPRRNHGNPTTQRTQVAENVVLDTEVIGDYVKGFPIRNL